MFDYFPDSVTECQQHNQPEEDLKDGVVVRVGRIPCRLPPARVHELQPVYEERNSRHNGEAKRGTKPDHQYPESIGIIRKTDLSD